MPTFTSEIIGFANAGDSRNKVIADTIINTPTATVSDATVSLDFVGDFGDVHGIEATEWFTVSIEGYALGGQFQALEYQPTTVPFTITAVDWAAIIADGKIEVTYTMGPQVDNLAAAAEEFIRLAFTWDTPVIHRPPSEPDPVLLTGTAGNDVLPGTAGEDIIDGGDGNDILFARGSGDTVKGGLGDDKIGGGEGNDDLYGDDGNDILFGGNGADEIHGGAGNDAIFGGLGDDIIYGDEGDDQVWGAGGNDQLKGAGGNDMLGGRAGNDSLSGGAGKDVLYGGVGNDRLFGDQGGDSLFGGAGRDILSGGTGNDSLSGGAGVDTFIFAAGDGNDVITDFEVGIDRIELSGQTYSVSANADGFALLTLSGGGTVLLEGIVMENLSDDWFLSA